MKYSKATTVITPLAILLLLACSKPEPVATNTQLPPYTPDSQELYDSIVALDEAWEDAYNNCKTELMDSLISEDLEFYHDRGGLETSKPVLMNAVKNNICGKVTRELLKGSIEVYPIPNFGAVQMGMHAFHNKQEPNATSHFSKFVHIWQRKNGQWRITRVISLH